VGNCRCSVLYVSILMIFYVPLILTPCEREPIYGLLTLTLALTLVDQ
jgi:hypothetical protein